MSKLIMLCGISGCGKSTYGAKYAATHDNYIVLSSDAIRAEVLGNVNDQSNNSLVFEILHKRVLDCLKANTNVIYDATNMTRKNRRSLIGSIPKDVRIECHIVWAPIDVCIKNDAMRDRTVGIDVINSMLKRFQMPYYDEGFHDIKIIYSDQIKKNFNAVEYTAELWKALDCPHDNPHHTYPIDKHIELASTYAATKGYDDNIIWAAQLHDIGKPYSKTFVNTKGETTEVAHYYGHPGVSTWLSFGIFPTLLKPTLDFVLIAWLISNHMILYTHDKYYNTLTQELKQQIDQLHDCDVSAH